MTWGIEVKVVDGKTETRQWGEVKDGTYTVIGSEDAQATTISTSARLPKKS